MKQIGLLKREYGTPAYTWYDYLPVYDKRKDAQGNLKVLVRSADGSLVWVYACERDVTL